MARNIEIKNPRFKKEEWVAGKKTKRMTVDIPPDLHKALKLYAAKESKKMREILIYSLEVFLNNA